MTVQQAKKKFYMVDYFLDGYFFKSEEMIGQELPKYGDWKNISSQQKGDIKAQVVGTEEISEDEYRIFMNSSSYI